MWINKNKAHEFFEHSIDMVDTCNKDVQRLTLAVHALGEVVYSLKDLVEIQNARIELLESKNGIL